MDDKKLYTNFVVDKCPDEIEAEIVSELVTVNDVIRYAASYLIENGVFLGHGTDSYWDEANYIVMCMLNLDPPGDPETIQARLTDREKRNIARALRIRVKERVPAAYLTHRAWFCGFEFYVDERVIIPRSPIAEMIQNNFAPYLKKTPERILDMCTGSGCIALACANQFQDAVVDAVDISEDALVVCEINVERYAVEDRVYPIQSDLFAALPEANAGDEVEELSKAFPEVVNEGYDLIVCNPPYVDALDLEDMPDEFHAEPKLALAAGDDGLDLVKAILAEASYYLAEDGILVVEVGNSMLALEEEFPNVKFNWVEFKNGGAGVFVMTYDELVEYAPYFVEFRRKH